jgi:hypothetical protein
VSETLTIQATAVSIDLAYWRKNAVKIAETAEGVAQLTETDLDDKAARLITALAQSPKLWDWFGQDVLGQPAPPEGAAYSFAETPQLAMAAEATEQKPEEFVEYIPAILAVLEIVMKIIERRRKRNG